MKRILVRLLFFYLSIAFLFVCNAVRAIESPRQVSQLDNRWRFYLGDEPDASSPTFRDRDWRTLDLPHDWSFEAGVSRDGAQGASGGYYSGGIGWYRKEFKAPTLTANHRLFIEFDGVYMNSEVWINGHNLGKFPYGYLSFAYNLTPHLKPGKNLIAVRCDNSQEPSARWYHPCGIYAPVRLMRRHRSHLQHVYVTTPIVSRNRATIHVDTELRDAQGCEVQHQVLSPTGKLAFETVGKQFEIAKPQLWSDESPQLYTLVTRLVKSGEVLDQIETRFGIRSIRWEPTTGFWLNGKNVKLKGVCEHWEAGPVGGAWTEELLRWKLETLQSMGCNAIRTAHNPCPPFFYNLCDELGILVMDEIFDGWKKKARHDYGKQAFAQHWEADLRSWLKRDRNHPSVVIWSVGNETNGLVAKDLVRICHELDPTCPVTSGHSGSEQMDVFGVNGGSERPSFFTGSHRPRNKAFVATEAPHTWQVRGYYRSTTWWRDGKSQKQGAQFPLRDLSEQELFTYDWTHPKRKSNPRKQVFNSSYDNATVRISARKNWELMRDLPWFSGHFRWTGFDYPGEAGYVHGGFPFRAFMGGTHDLAGFAKDLVYFYQSQWTDEPMVHLLPHWTHPKLTPGTKVPVWAYSNADEVELLLDDQSLGVRRPGRLAEQMQCEWLVPWAPGQLTAIARIDGKEVARTAQTTAGAPATLDVEVDTRENGLRILTTTIADAAGVHAPYADNRVYVQLPGQARLYSHENGNPVDTENGVTSNSRRGFMGKTRTFLRACDDGAPAIVAAILGSRNGVTEPEQRPLVAIHVQSVPLSASGGPVALADCRVFYTLDGSEPTKRSLVYEQPFRVSLPTEVRALVVRDGHPSLALRESFASDTGLHWMEPSEKVILAGSGGTQAETAELVGRAYVASEGKGFQGTGYVDLSNRGDGVRWYQENDGTAGNFKLSFRYAQQTGAKRRTVDLIVNDRKLKQLTFGDTGSWDRQWKSLSTTVKLNAGANEILVRATAGGGPRIDELVVEEELAAE